ncbi:MAG: CotH kinase family protein [Candidatus Sabulitectum sp.]|nr:CotH kinase family protein [Candidatus Sabulitectum sp.]
MFILALFIVQSALPLYEVEVDPVYLQQLVADPYAELEVPAVVSLSGVSGECTLAFRGGTSLECRKKSWHIRVENPYLFPCGGHILLNAQFRDASLMRNSLGLYLTRELGFPASETEFVSYSINSENMGVYERVERVDRLFYERNGLSFGPLFKNVDTMGRLAHHFSDTTGLAGYEPKIDSYPYGGQLLELIEACFREDVSSLEVDEILAAYAVHVAIGDNDGIIKNFYIHKSDDVWHYYPWDRDATFGNSWQGVYDSNWVTRPHLGDIGYFGATRGIFSNQQNLDEFNSLLEQSADILENSLPQMVDSIRLLIRNDLTSDPYYEYSISQFDSICSVIIEDVEARADFLEDLSLNDEIPVVKTIFISSCLDMGSTFDVEISFKGEEPSSVACVVAFGGQPEQWFYMVHSEVEKWTISIPIPSGTYCAHIAFGPIGSALRVFYPAWAIREYQHRPEPTPSARVALAGLSPQHISPGSPVWCGENLWVLPVTNTSSELQDISLCRFALGSPEGNVFLTDSILVSPGETFYLSNSRENAEVLYTGFSVYGDAGTTYPAGTTLELFDPSWNTIHTWQIGTGDSLPESPGIVIPSEICASGGSDWIELYNCSEDGVDLSGWYLMDSESNVSVIPENTTISPGGLLLAAVDPGSFEQSNCQVIQLDFSINQLDDSLYLYSRFGDREFHLSWYSAWPIAETGIMYLKDPQASITYNLSWAASTPPGTPGDYNPGWSLSSDYARVFLISQNPGNGSFSFYYETSAPEAEAILFDLAGRKIAAIDLPGTYQGEVVADFSNTLPNGVYILYLRSSTSSASTRLTVLN